MTLSYFLNSRNTLNQLLTARGFHLPYSLINLDTTVLTSQYQFFLVNKRSPILNISHQETVNDVAVRVTVLFIKEYAEIKKVISKHLADGFTVNDQLIVGITNLL